MAVDPVDWIFLNEINFGVDELDLLRKFQGNPRQSSRWQKDRARIRTAMIEHGATLDEVKRAERHVHESYADAERAADGLGNELLALLLSRDEFSSARSSWAGVPVAITWTAQVNALTIRMPSGSHGILMDLGAVTLTRALAVAIGDWVRSQSRPETKLLKDFSRWRALALCACGLAYLSGSGGLPALASLMSNYISASREGPFDLGAHHFAGVMQEFILAHELGHMTLGHLDGKSYATRNFARGGQSLEVVANAQSDELEADAYASRRLTTMQEWAQVAAFMFIFEAAAPIRGVANPAHPRWKTRLDNLMQECPPTFRHDVEIFLSTIEVFVRQSYEMLYHFDVNDLHVRRLRAE